MSPTFKERINQSRSVTAPSRMPTQASLEEEKKRETANALRQYLLAPQSPVKTTPVSSPSPAPRPKNRSPRVLNRPPPPFAAIPMSPNRNAYQPHSPRSPAGSGYFPMFASPSAHLMEQRSAPYTTPPPQVTTRGPAPFFQPPQFDAYMAPPPFSGALHGKMYHNNHNSFLISSLEGVKAPVTQKSATDLENDLRRILMI